LISLATHTPPHTLRIGLVAGEASGDALGADLIRAIKARLPDYSLHFEGAAGPAMIAEGCVPLVHSEELAVMGLIEVLAHVPRLLKIRRRLRKHFLSTRPDVFIGIDSPDFNLTLEAALHRRGIRTVHYVSPSVWAWRQGRVKKIAKAVDRVLTLLPFEAEFYRNRQVGVTYVGHPLADRLPLVTDSNPARVALGLSTDRPIVAVLPGSRQTELRYLAPSFIDTMAWLHQRRPDIHFVAPMANPKIRDLFEVALEKQGVQLPITLVDGQSLQVMAAADVILLASGTATLEAMLVKRPMVVAYRVSPLTYRLIKPLVKVSDMALPNLLAGERVVEEFLQDAVTPEQLGPAVLRSLDDDAARVALISRFTALHEQLRGGASKRAAQAVLEVAGINLSE